MIICAQQMRTLCTERKLSQLKCYLRVALYLCLCASAFVYIDKSGCVSRNYISWTRCHPLALKCFRFIQQKSTFKLIKCVASVLHSKYRPICGWRWVIQLVSLICIIWTKCSQFARIVAKLRRSFFVTFTHFFAYSSLQLAIQASGLL